MKQDKLKVVRAILNHLVEDELHPDEFCEGDVIVNHLNKAIAIIDDEYETEEEYNEIMEEVFNTPYPCGRYEPKKEEL